MNFAIKNASINEIQYFSQLIACNTKTIFNLVVLDIQNLYPRDIGNS